MSVAAASTYVPSAWQRSCRPGLLTRTASAAGFSRVGDASCGRDADTAVLDWRKAIAKTQPGTGEMVVDQAISRAALPPDISQVVLVLQGGGALELQFGVYQALHEAGIEPDWVIGTSLGAIYASLIAGNDVADRLSRLAEFWSRIQQAPFHQAMAPLPLLGGLKQTGSRLLVVFQAFSSPIHLPSLVPTYR